MRILIVHRYFYPDSPTYAYLLYKLAKNYGEYFKKVSVLTSMPSYYGSSDLKDIPHEEHLDGISIKRLKLLPEHGRNFFWRSVNSFLFAWRVFWHLLFKGGDYDFVQVATTPPIVSAMAVALASKMRRIRFVYHCQDIYPDITQVSKPNDQQQGTFYKLMWKLDRFIMNSAWKIVVLSEDMKRHIINTRKLQPDKIAVINNFDFSRVASPQVEGNLPDSLKFIDNDNRKKVVFAGNLGFFQNLDIVFKVLSEITIRHEVTFIVIGDGIKRKELEEKHNNNRIIFTGYLPNEVVRKTYSYCHLGLAPVISGIEKVAYPSKIISYTLAGLPVLTFSSKGSLIEKFVDENEMGDNYAFEGEEVLKQKILAILLSDFNRDKLKTNASREFGEAVAYNKWKDIYQNQKNN